MSRSRKLTLSLGLIIAVFPMATGSLGAPERLPWSAPPTSSKTASVTTGADAFAAKAAARRAAAKSAAPRTPAELLESVRAGLERYHATFDLGLAHRADAQYLASPAAAQQLATLIDHNGDDLRVFWRAGLRTPRALSGPDLFAGTRARPGQSEATARAFLRAHHDLLRIDDPDLEFRHVRTHRDERGNTAVRYQQMHRGVEVWGSDVVVRFDSAGRVRGFSGHYRPTPTLDVDASQGKADARLRAVDALAVRDGVRGTPGEAELVVYPHRGQLRPAWRMEIARGLAYRKEALLDATTGELLNVLDLVPHGNKVAGSGVDLNGEQRNLELFPDGANFLMIDTTKPMFNAGQSNLPQTGVGVIYVLDAQNGDGSQLFFAGSTNANDWTGQENMVSASANGSIVHDYFRDRHNRNSLDDNGMNMQLIVNFDNNFNNAFWNGQFMVFGNGDGNQFSDLAGALDVTGHEMSHGVVEHTAGLVYQFQPGALNEHFADVFGAGVEFFARGNAANWLMGEEITSPNVNGDGLRDMERPDGPLVAFGQTQPAHMDDFRNLPADTDNGGVHINSGIPNRAFFLASDPASSVGGIGIEKTEDIWYAALSQHLNRNSDFQDFRVALLQAASDLFGGGSNERATVAAALDAVGILDENGGGGGGYDGDLCDNAGQDFLAFVDSQTGQVWRGDDTLQQFIPLTPNAVGPDQGQGINLSGRPSFTDDGALLTWVAADGNIWVGGSDGQGAQALTTDGAWWSVAINADGSLLSATPLQEDANIYVFDTGTGNGQAFPLQGQVSQDPPMGSDIAFADVMEFGALGDRIVFDALHRVEVNGNVIEYWDINILRLFDGISVRVFQAVPSGESIGNPTFAQNNEFILAFDHLANDGNIYVETVNIQSGDQGLVTNNLSSLGRPTFNGSDNALIYQYTGNDPPETWIVSLDASSLVGQGDDVAILQGTLAPVFFTVGARCPTPVLLTDFDGTWSGQDVDLTWSVSGLDELRGFHLDRTVDGGRVDRRNLVGIPVDPTEPDGSFRFVDRIPTGAQTTEYRLFGEVADGREVQLGSVELTAKDLPSIAEVMGLSNHPNPFNPSTMIRFEIPPTMATETTRLAIFDARGRRVKTLIAGQTLAAGPHEIAWRGLDDRGTSVAAGHYFVRLTAGTQRRTHSMMLLK